MSAYAYKAMNTSGRVVRGQLEALNAVDLEMRLKRMGLDFIDGALVRKRRARFKPSRQELITFCIHLEQLTRSGVPIIESLVDLRDTLDNPRFREVIAGLVEAIDGGQRLSQAMASRPEVFDLVFASLIRTGEETGRLSEVLKNLTEKLKWEDELASHAKKILIFPAFAGTIVLGAVTFLMIGVVPQMVQFVKGMGQALPFHTKALIWTSDAFVHYWYLIFGVPIAVIGGTLLAARSNYKLRLQLDRLKLSLPLLGPILQKIILARFASVFAMMYGAGITILDSIKMTEEIAGNLVIKEALQQVGQQIAEGQIVTQAFQNAGLFPPLVVRMLRVGESTGALDEALLNVSYFYNREVNEAIGKIQAVIEPALTVALGLIMMWIAAAVLGPIYDTISKIKT
jgi:type IV pilus assembly protein PilC